MNKSSSHTFSFLLEFVIILFFFAISSLLCIQLFTSAIHINTVSNEKKELLEYAENYIETKDVNESTYYLNSNFKESKKGIYKVSITYSKHRYHMNIKKGKENYLHLSFYKGNNHE